MSTNFSPREIVSELDRYIVGQEEAKKAVSIALRNRWRRQQLQSPMKEEVLPKNILMIGPTGVGKTEIARRLAKLSKAPFIKVEATKFTEIGYVGKDVESIIRDMIEISITMTRQEMRKSVEAKAELGAEKRVLAALVGENASEETKSKFRQKLISGELDDKEIEIDVLDSGNGSMPSFDIPGMPGAQVGMLSLGDILGKGKAYKRRKMKVSESYKVLIAEESDKLLDEDMVIKEAIRRVEEEGIVFLDEIDKITSSSDDRGNRGNVSREGVQRDLLPLIEGTTVTTKHGMVKTEHILFIASGAFHVSSPSDLLPELQGRLPIRVELNALGKDDFIRILTEPEANLIIQTKVLLETENFTLSFAKEAIEKIAELAEEVNRSVENIGARRLHTLLEKLLEEISFTASDRSGEVFEITKEYVEEKLSSITQKTDLSKFIL